MAANPAVTLLMMVGLTMVVTADWQQQPLRIALGWRFSPSSGDCRGSDGRYYRGASAIAPFLVLLHASFGPEFHCRCMFLAVSVDAVPVGR